MGVNYTTFFDEEVRGGLASAGYGSLELDDSWGLAAQLGLDIDVSDHWFVNFDVRYIGIDTEASVRERSVGNPVGLIKPRRGESGIAPLLTPAARFAALNRACGA